MNPIGRFVLWLTAARICSLSSATPESTSITVSSPTCTTTLPPAPNIALNVDHLQLVCASRGRVTLLGKTGHHRADQSSYGRQHVNCNPHFFTSAGLPGIGIV